MKTVLSLYKEYLDKELIRFDEKQNSILLKLSQIIPFNYGILSNLRNLFLGKEIYSENELAVPMILSLSAKAKALFGSANIFNLFI